MKREIPAKNYVILACIVLLTVIGVFYIRDWYNTSKEYYAQNSVMTDVVREIKNEEISNYTLENPKFILYVSSGQNISLKDFEDNLKKLIQDMDISDDVLYMNLDGVDNSFYSSLKSKFTADVKIRNQIISDSSASMYMFTDGKITTVLSNVNNYSMKRLKTIIQGWESNNA